MKKVLNESFPDMISADARTESVQSLVEFVARHAWEAGFADDKIKQINLAVEEALNNIIEFACHDGGGDITISCSVHDSGSLIVTIVDTGKPFNMLIASSFPEAVDFTESSRMPSTKIMKRYVGNIEYRRDVNRNILILTIMRMI